ncbi:MAG: RNA polymerase factor sigma-54 [Candidatus Omnitrophica bacterium]|nr:RNA polymerase factor sigma-54 [Candidatus Omnitrophota bacterium]MBU1809163.1 RNA polymerase factor sigma-54 [Candidatus Omnitrophota bacterium]
MQLELKPANKLIYKLRLTPQMRLAINLLQMPLVKLKEFVEKQVEENPLLNLENIKPPKEVNYDFTSEEDQNYKESLITKPATLQDHLLSQLQLLADSDDVREIGELIIGNINDDGYFECPIEDIKSESRKITQSEVEKVLSLVQTFDPIGIGARDLRECLLLQLRSKGSDNSLAYQIVDKYLPDLQNKRYNYIAKKLKVPVEKIKEAIKEIANLEPKPGRSFSTERPVYLIPDAIVRKNKDGYELIPNDWELPRITLNEKYKRMLKQKDTPEDAKVYLNERLNAARSLINAISKRRETIRQVTQTIVSIQNGFLENGATDFKPMTLEQIAKRIGKHKSTVCRAVTGKYLQTPQGIFELRSFLSSRVKQENGNFLSSKAIKSRTKNLIENENKEKPLTDEEIVDLFKKDGVSVARRTVAKYRDQLKILSSKTRCK